MRSLSIEEVLELHRRIIERSGGSAGLRSHAALESSLAQPHQTFSGQELYPSIPEKAGALLVTW